MYPEMNKTKAGLVIKVLFTPLGVGLSLERIKPLERSDVRVLSWRVPTLATRKG